LSSVWEFNWDLPVVGVVADQEGLGQIVAGVHHHAVVLGPLQKGAGLFGLGGDLQVEDADDPALLHHHVLPDVQISHQTTSPPRM
jgi:hypothetical protein